MKPEAVTPERARADLDHARTISAAARSASRWTVLFQALLGVAFGAMTLLLGLLGSSPSRIGVITGCMLSAVGGLTWWALRQDLIPRHFGRRYAPLMVTTTMLYTAVLIGGRDLLPSHPGAWVPAGVLVATPLLLGSWHASRR